MIIPLDFTRILFVQSSLTHIQSGKSCFSFLSGKNVSTRSEPGLIVGSDWGEFSFLFTSLCRQTPSECVTQEVWGVTPDLCWCNRTWEKIYDFLFQADGILLSDSSSRNRFGKCCFKGLLKENVLKKAWK